MTDSEREQAISTVWTKIWTACELEDKAMATQLWSELRILIAGRSEEQREKMGMRL